MSRDSYPAMFIQVLMGQSCPSGAASSAAATRKKRRTRFIPSAFDRRRPLPVEALEALEALGA